MRQTEQKFWDRMRNNLRRWPIKIERIENVIGVGTPDTHTIGAGCAAWVELKSTPELPVRAETPVLSRGEPLSRDQVNWHLDYALHGGRSYVAIGIGSFVVMVVPGRLAVDINKMHFGDMARASAAIGWEEFSELLMGHRK